MTAEIIDGKAFAEGVRARVTRAVPTFVAAARRAPGLAVVLVGDDPASHVYVRNKHTATLAVGMESFEHRLLANVSQADVLALVAALNADETVDGILVQLPLPRHIDAAAVLMAIDPTKDVDGFHPVNAGRLATGLPALVPCTPSGCLLLLHDVLGSLSGAEALVIGRSNIVGKPMANLLVQTGPGGDATVTVCHSRSRDLPGIARSADILIVAIGKSEFVTADMVRPGAVVIDVGINRVPDASAPMGYRITGDVAYGPVAEIASAITPVPGGVGRMTIAMLLQNTLQAARLQHAD